MFRSIPFRLIACILLAATPLTAVAAEGFCAPGLGRDTNACCCGSGCQHGGGPASSSKTAHACCSTPPAKPACCCESGQRRPLAPEPGRSSDRRERDAARRADSAATPLAVVPDDREAAGVDMVPLFSLPTLRRQANLCRWLT
jgi:hypothetical protein